MKRLFWIILVLGFYSCGTGTTITNHIDSNNKFQTLVAVNGNLSAVVIEESDSLPRFYIRFLCNKGGSYGNDFTFLFKFKNGTSLILPGKLEKQEIGTTSYIDYNDGRRGTMFTPTRSKNYAWVEIPIQKLEDLKDVHRFYIWNEKRTYLAGGTFNGFYLDGYWNVSKPKKLSKMFTILLKELEGGVDKEYTKVNN